MEQKENEDPQDILEKIKNLSLQYNTKVTPRRKIQIEKPKDAFQILLTPNPRSKY